MIDLLLSIIVISIGWAVAGFYIFIEEDKHFPEYKKPQEKFVIFWCGPVVWLCVLIYVVCEFLSDNK